MVEIRCHMEINFFFRVHASFGRVTCLHRRTEAYKRPSAWMPEQLKKAIIPS